MTRGDSWMRWTDIVVQELDLALVDRARDRRRARRLRRARERDVPFAGEQARGRIEADPAGAGQVDLAPRVQVGEVLLGARRAVERFDVGGQLDQVAGDEPRGEAEVAEQLHEQPRGVAAGARRQLERFLRRPARRGPGG